MGSGMGSNVPEQLEQARLDAQDCAMQTFRIRRTKPSAQERKDNSQAVYACMKNGV